MTTSTRLSSSSSGHITLCKGCGCLKTRFNNLLWSFDRKEFKEFCHFIAEMHTYANAFGFEGDEYVIEMEQVRLYAVISREDVALLNEMLQNACMEMVLTEAREILR